jgi:hypothetical protein
LEAGSGTLIRAQPVKLWALLIRPALGDISSIRKNMPGWVASQKSSSRLTKFIVNNFHSKSIYYKKYIS